jgi:hypothetical protein
MATTLESAARILARRRNSDKQSRAMLVQTLAMIRKLRAS